MSEFIALPLEEYSLDELGKKNAFNRAFDSLHCDHINRGDDHIKLDC